ncbi:hypothetical protein [Litchfieldia alkalitelluris]|uniref:hypothetical protein n=1 Tax=Litchfieldia alkalitelluris TaxID=304268 RepID=UPI000996B7C0|nr:hypothetical protein [Litchfieldia alkalitelluris]
MLDHKEITVNLEEITLDETELEEIEKEFHQQQVTFYNDFIAKNIKQTTSTNEIISLQNEAKKLLKEREEAFEEESGAYIKEIKVRALRLTLLYFLFHIKQLRYNFRSKSSRNLLC